MTTASAQITLSGLPVTPSNPSFVDPPLGSAAPHNLRVYRSVNGGNFELLATLLPGQTSLVDTGAAIANPVLMAEPTATGTTARPRPDANLVIDPAIVVKSDGARIDVGVGASFIAEGQAGLEVVLTSLSDDRYGAGGTFDTGNDGGTSTSSAAQEGDWAGIYFSPDSSGSIDRAVIAYGGGLNRIEGNFAGFNVIEIRQADVRIANSEFEFNADGTGGQAPADRFGRGFNEAATIFVRGAQPVILNNAVHDDESAFININVNSLTSELIVDTGRQTGFVGRFAGYQDNNGPLIRGNRLQDNGINGMVVRGAVLTTEVVWDDTDIAHVLFDTIVIPDLHTFGGLRLESSGTESLVVKSSGATAGFVATGRPLEIDDRIGGVIHVLGQPGFPVVLTSFSDDTASAGIDLQGNPQNDTNGDGLGSGLLPTGPEVNNGLLIDNDVAIGTVGQFAYNVGPAGSSNFGGGVTAQGQSMLFANQDFIFEFLNYVDVGSDGLAIDLATSTITQAPTLLADDLVESRGTFQGQNGLITWIVQTRLDDGVATVFNTITFTSTAPLGNLQFINYLDEDVLGISDDVLYRVGSPGQADFRLFTLDGQEKIGFAQGGIYTAGPGLVNATYTGWAADEYSDLSFDIETTGTTYSPTGNVDLIALPVVADPDLGNVNGPADVTTAMAWTVNPTATTATITTFLELIARNPVSSGTAGEWQGIVIDEYSHDRNVETVLEQESAVSDGTVNNSPSKAQYLGGLASAEKNGDENLRLGFTVHGLINRNDDIDVYSFKALPGTEVWFDIDRTSVAFDAVIELVDENGIVLARSNNSTAENSGAEALFGTARDMQKTPPYQGQDFYTTNVKDPGMRIVLAGPAGQQSTYHIRIRSNTTNLLANPPIAGQTNGAYQLQIRLREVDEFGGSTVRYADIRNAVNGIAVLGQPAHSPLAGERGETTANNNTFANAQNLGNLLTNDRGTLSVAGSLSAFDDVDWYRITLDNTLPSQAAFWNAIFDIDYADGLARPNTALYVFDELGRLILTSRDSNIAEDRPSAAPGSGISDLSRGSAGGGDPYIGTVALPTNIVNPNPPDATEFYYVAISSDLRMPAQLEQFFQANASNPLLRLEPVESVQRIVEDHIGAFMTRSTAAAPDVQVFIEAQNAIQYTISDVVLYVNMSADDGTEQTRLVTVDPFTGDNETYLSNFARDTGDLVLREDNRLFSYTIDLDDNFTLDDAESGNYIELNTGTGAFTTIGDDGIITYESNLGAPPAPVVSNLGVNNTRWGYGLQFNAMAFSDIGYAFDANGNQLSERLIAVGNRGDVNSNNPASTAIDRRQNIVYSMDANTGAAQITGAGARLSGSGTGVYEVGEILTSSRLTFLSDATTGTGLAGFAVNDGLTFGVNTEASSTTFEFDSGFDVQQLINTATGQTIQDGYFFILDSDTTLGNQNEVLYQFDTGVVITVNPGLLSTGIVDGSTFTVRVNGVPRVFEFDNTGAVTAGNIAVNVGGGIFGADVIAARISNAIDTQTAAAFPVDGYVEPLGNRISLIPTVATPIPITATLGTSSAYLTFQGANGTAPVLQGVNPAGIGEGTTFTVSNGVTNFTFEFDRDNAVSGTNIRVNIFGATTSTDVAGAIEAAVATLPATSGLNATRFGDRVIVNGQGVTFSRQTSAVYSLTDSIANGGLQTVQVSVEERDGSAVVGAAVLAAMNNGNPRFAAGAAFDRINFPPINTGGLTPVASIDISAVPVWSPVAGTAPGVAGGREQIPFLASDTANQLANRAVTAINAALNATEGITAQFSGGNVELNRGTFTIGATTALAVSGQGPGGNITGIVDITPPPGIAQGMNQLIRYYLAVSDNGGLYIVELDLFDNQNITPNSPAAIANKTNQVRTYYIGNSADSLSGIAFQALTKGPENVEGGRYQNVWYAVADGPGNGDNQSRLHAFNFDATFETTAEWNAFRNAFLTNNTAALNARFTGRAPVFVDGATSIPLFYTVPQGAEGNAVPIRRAVTDAKGIAFSSLDQNLWKQTTTQSGAAGHEGGNSLVFGNDGQEQWAGNTYNFPGGATGSIVSNEFSLENYSVGDQPVLYYSYLGATDGSNDSVRVYISGVNDADRDGIADNNPGQWTLLTQSGGSTYLNTGWRQVRLNLGDFAGWSNLRLRFDFSTAGEMNVGDAGTTGDELRAVDAKYILDGDVVTIGGTTFEFESGVTLTMPSGRAINDGENFTIQINGAPQVYEFDKNGTQSIPGSTLIPVTNATTPEQVTLLLRDAIVANQAGPGPIVTPRIEGGVEWIFPDASAYALIPDNQLQFTLDDGTNPPVTFELDRDNASTPGTIPVEFSLAMDSARIALEVARAIQGYANGLQTGDNLHVTASYRQPNIVQIEGLVDYNANFALQLLKETPYSGNRLNLQGAEAFTQSAVHAIVATGAVGVANPNNVPVNIHLAMRARDVAQSFDAVLETAFRNQQLVVQNGSLYEDGQVIDIDHDGDGGLLTPDIRFEIETGLIVSIPGNGAVGPGGVADGDTITITNGGAPVTFEFSTDGVPAVPTNVLVSFRATDSQAVIARAFEAAINGQGSLGITARVVSGSRIQLSSGALSPNLTFATSDVTKYNTGNTFAGVAVGNTPIIVSPTAQFTAQQMAAAVAAAINAAGVVGFSAQTNAGVPNQVELLSTDVRVSALDSIGLTIPAPQPINGTGVAPAAPNIVFETGVFDIAKRERDLMRIIGRNVTARGPLGLQSFGMTGELPDHFQNGNGIVAGFTSSLRGQDNNHEGFYIDDIIIGLAERGESASGATTATGFVVNPLGTGNTSGAYQLEIRRGPAYDRFVGTNPGETANSNDRYAQEYTIVAKSGAELADGVTFTLSDGINRVTFEFDEVALPGRPALPVAVTPGNQRIAFSSTDTADEVAVRIRDAINSSQVQAVLKLTAGLADGTLVGNVTTSNRVNVVGAATVAIEGRNAVEVNDTLSQAVATNFNGTQYFAQGTIGDNPELSISRDTEGHDVDLFSIRLSAGQTIRIDIDTENLNFSSEVGNLLDTVLRIFDSTGAELASSDDDFAPGEERSFDLTTRESYLEFRAPHASGTVTYYIGVSGFGNQTYSFPNATTVVGTESSSTLGFYQLEISTALTSSLEIEKFEEELGDKNLFRDQGQILLYGNTISNSSQWGILVNNGTRTAADGNAPHQGPVRNLREQNIDRLVPGVVISNNVIHSNTVGGIRYSGDGGIDAPVSFGRIINNTLYGTGGNDVGIQVDQAASPTLLNNIVANFGQGVNVDALSSSTVLGGMVYQGNTSNSNVGVGGDFPLVLGPTDPLFVNAGLRNFYPAPGSQVIDSSVGSLLDRTSLVTVKNPMGIGLSPIIAPERDAVGQLRTDDPAVSTANGFGLNPNIDRGAIDRVDFTGPTSILENPRDNDAEGVDLDPTVSVVTLENTVLNDFTIRLVDRFDVNGPAEGSDIDDFTVTGDKVTVTSTVGTTTVTLVEGVDYSFSYDSTNNIIRLTPLGGLWPLSRTYRITLDNSATGIRDLAGNALSPNQIDGMHYYTIFLGSAVDWGDLPDSYGTLAANLLVGPSHQVVGGIQLGALVTSEPDGNPAAPGTDANLDNGDDGIQFVNLQPSNAPNTSQIIVTATATGNLSAWFDYNRNGVFDTNEMVLDNIVIGTTPGVGETIFFQIPADVAKGDIYARFRFSTSDVDSPNGALPDGEVEDYRLTLTGAPFENTAPLDQNNDLINDGFLDVTADGAITPLDALIVINFLNLLSPQFGGGPIPLPNATLDSPLPPPPGQINRYVDTDGNGVLTPFDALQVINYLNLNPNQFFGEGEPAADGAEGEPSSTSAISFSAPASVEVASAPQLELSIPSVLYSSPSVVLEVRERAPQSVATVSSSSASSGSDWSSDDEFASLALADYALSGVSSHGGLEVGPVGHTNWDDLLSDIALSHEEENEDDFFANL
nr:GEVED domain-containing protein [Pirellula staleyi]